MESHVTIKPALPYLGSNYNLETCLLKIHIDSSLSNIQNPSTNYLRFYEGIAINSGSCAGWVF